MTHHLPCARACKKQIARLALSVFAALPTTALGAPQAPSSTPASAPATAPATSASATEEQLQRARTHAWEGRLAEAIRALRQIVAENPEHRSARIELARYLSWSGATRAAIAHADHVLASAPDDIDALRVKADAAAWQGDLHTSLPLYRRALAIKDDAGISVAYAHALLSAGYLDAARTIHDRLATQPAEVPAEALAQLDQRAARLAAPAVRPGASRYHDSDGSNRREQRMGVSTTVGDTRLRMLAEKIEADDDHRTIDADRLTFGFGMPVHPALYLEATGGVMRIDSPRTDTYAVGLVRGSGRSGPLAYQARLEHSVFDETALILANRIRRTELETQLDYAFTDRLRLSARYEYADYSDHNAAQEFELTPQIVLWQGNPGVRLGYRRTQLQFDRQSGGGYFDPDRLDADRLMLFATHYGDRVRWDFELFAGRQVFDRFGRRGKDDIAGGSARLAFDLGQRWTIEAELEGGNFALQTAGGFRYTLLSVDLVARF